MKRTEAVKELRGLSADDLKERVRSLSEELMKLRFRAATQQLDHSHRLGEVRRNLARAKTVLAEKSKPAAA